MAASPAESEAAEQRSRKITFQFCRDWYVADFFF